MCFLFEGVQFVFFFVRGCSPLVFHLFISLATALIHFLAFWGVLSAIFPHLHPLCHGVYRLLAFVLFSPGFPWFSNFPVFFQRFSLILISCSLVPGCLSLVFGPFPYFSLFLFGLLVYLGFH